MPQTRDKQRSVCKMLRLSGMFCYACGTLTARGTMVRKGDLHGPEG